MNTSSLCNYTNDDLAKLILRLMVGFLMLFHGIAKVSHGVDGMMIFILAVPYDDKIFTLTKNGSWAIELHMFYIMSLLSIFFLGAGKYSISKK